MRYIYFIVKLHVHTCTCAKTLEQTNQQKKIGVFCFVLLIVIIQSIDPVSHLISAYADERSLAPITCSFFEKKMDLFAPSKRKKRLERDFLLS